LLTPGVIFPPMLVYNATNARDLVQKCQALSHNTTSGLWFFRGQGDSEWGLTPSLFRKRKLPEAREFENRLLDNLTRVVHDRTELPTRLADDPNMLLALAQHYGVETRLLDWTLDPLAALYFGATGALREGSNSFSVFVMASIYIQVSNEDRGQIVRPPRTANVNLVAQKGLLVKHSWELEDLWDKTRAQPTTDPVQDVSAVIETRLVRLDLNATYASKAVELCIERGIDSSIMFPGRDGLVRLAEDLSMLDKVTAARVTDSKLLYLMERHSSLPDSRSD
jgi:hypothetical protein